MIGKIKQGIRDALTDKYDSLYLQELEEKTCSYDEWIRNRESLENAEKSKGNMDLFRGSYVKDLQPVKAEQVFQDAEIVVFADRKENISSITENEIKQVFASDPAIQAVYGDEDEVNSNGTVRMNPWFKPDYSPDTLLSYFYFGSLVAVRRSAVMQAAERRKDSLKDIAAKINSAKTDTEQITEKFPDSTTSETGQKTVYIEFDKIEKKQLYELILQICLPLHRTQIYHSKKMLYTSHAVSCWGWEEEYDSIKEACKNLRERKNVTGVSIVIPSKDNPEVLKRCLSSIVKYTTNIPYEIIVVDNGSKEENKKQIEEQQKDFGFTYLYHPMEFNFSIMCNMGAGKAVKELLLFLNDDCEVRSEKWLSSMAELAAVKATGAVGAKLYYPDSKKIQHCGIYNIHVGPVHKLQFKDDIRAYYDRRNKDIRNVMAVTAACLMVRKEVFEQAGGFDQKLQVAFNDVDFCYRLYKMGYNNVVNNAIHLWHYESLSRGSDESSAKMERLMQEKYALYERHKELWNKDPYYHSGFTSHILDTGYSFAYEYNEKEYAVEEPVKISSLPAKIREDACVAPMIEYAGSLENWFMDHKVIEKIKQQVNTEALAYLQGNAVVLGSDNACFEKYIVLRHEQTGTFYQIQPQMQYRPDLFANLQDQTNIALSGFACLINMSHMPKGRYEVAVMVKDRISRQYLLRITTRSICNQ